MPCYLQIARQAMHNDTEEGDVVQAFDEVVVDRTSPEGRPFVPPIKQRAAFDFVKVELDVNHPRIQALLEPLRSDVRDDTPGIDEADRFPVVHKRRHKVNVSALGSARWVQAREMPEASFRALVSEKSPAGRLAIGRRFR